ncbi:MAG: 23S rRNA (pseudouridine(1915)-N(3))-methyltransferase RlmH [Gammaproteobacteria bacterium]|nr:23S rRNA (pseudouridine(1915)-N(3))-methyltransferase RlmH [Gammaproteobacteria bacterium]
MKIIIISIASKNTNYDVLISDYKKRLPSHIKIEHLRIPIGRRSKTKSVKDIVQAEGKRLLKMIKNHDILIALDEKGDMFSTKELANSMNHWFQDAVNPIFAIGGPDGFSKEVLDRANMQWSLSKLTLPHAMVPVIIIEQIYRSWSMLNNQPYHRS